MTPSALCSAPIPTPHPGDHDADRVAAEVLRALVQLGAAAAAGIERLERRHPLHRVEVLGVQAAVGLHPRVRAPLHQPRAHDRGHRGGERAGEDDRADGRIEHDHVGGDPDGADDRRGDLRQETPDQRVQMLDRVDRRRLHAAAAGALERTRAELEQLGGQALADRLLDGTRDVRRTRLPRGEQPRARDLQQRDPRELGEDRPDVAARDDLRQHARDEDALREVGDRDQQAQHDEPCQRPPCRRGHRQQPLGQLSHEISPLRTPTRVRAAGSSCATSRSTVSTGRSAR